jgi:hypothetical protein
MPKIRHVKRDKGFTRRCSKRIKQVKAGTLSYSIWKMKAGMDQRELARRINVCSIWSNRKVGANPRKKTLQNCGCPSIPIKELFNG